MKLRAFADLEQATLWSVHGGVALCTHPCHMVLMATHASDWMYYWAGRVGCQFVRTVARGTPLQHVVLNAAEMASALSMAEEGPPCDLETPTVVFFTGTRRGWTDDQAEAVRAWVFGRKIILAHHGCAVGADFQFHHLLALGRKFNRRPWIVGWPAELPDNLAGQSAASVLDCDDKMPPRPPLERNHVMIARAMAIRSERPEASVQVLATPFEMAMQKRGGTWATVRAAVVAELPTTLIHRDGSVEMAR